MKFFSAFSGIGGFDEGIRRIIPNSECVGFSEVDKYAIKIYEKHFPDRTNYGDIKKIKTETIPDFDMFCGGFPCQDLSVAGKRTGLQGKRSGLFFEIIRIIREKQPSIVFLENVKGLFSSNGGWDFSRILIELDESGYDVEWQCLNSKDFGVPQNRERVFIIGHLRGKTRQEIFPIKYETNGTTIERVIEIIGDTPSGLSRQGERVYSSNHLSPTLQAHFSCSIPLIMDNNKIRLLTPVECERLQGYHDGWTEGIPDTQRYKCLGNAVTVNVIEAIVKKILFLSSHQF